MQAFPGQGYVTYDKEPMNIGVIYNDVKTKFRGCGASYQICGLPPASYQ